MDPYSSTVHREVRNSQHKEDFSGFKRGEKTKSKSDSKLNHCFCFLGFTPVQYWIPDHQKFTVYLGGQTQGGSNPNEVKGKVAQIIIHPDYLDTLWNDVALMKLSSPVTYSDYIRPICLASSSSRFSTHTLCWATGWGTFNFTGEYGAGLSSHPPHTVCPLCIYALCLTHIRLS